MSDLISRDAFLEHWNKEYRHQYANDMIKIAIAIFPATEAEPVVNAFWKKRVSHGAYWYACSNCDEENPRDRYGHDYFSRRCPHCGAHMDFESEATDE